VTLAEAIAFAEEVKSSRHKPSARTAFNKLQGSATAVDRFAAGVVALSKSYDAMGGTVAGMQKRIDQMRADLDHAVNSPGQRRLQS
jgi:hypothetical protein